MMTDMNECGASLSSLLAHQKRAFGDAHHLATTLQRIYYDSLTTNDWPNVTCELKHQDAVEAYKVCWERIHDVYRSSSAAVCDEQGLQPLKQAVTKIAPDVETTRKERDEKLVDYDSYKRRLRNLQSKKADFEAQGKGSSKNAHDNLHEISRFEAKVDATEKLYLEKNQKVKTDTINAKRAHDLLVDQLLITTIVTQYELFTRAAEQLQQVLSVLPPEKISQAKARIDSYINEGGIRPKSIQLKSNFSLGLDILTGKAPLPTTSTTTTVDSIPDSKSSLPLPTAPSSPYNITSKETVAPPAPQSPAPVVKPVEKPTGPHYVQALYDHVAEAEDELSFNAGDQVEVLETCEGGWWRGRVRGNEGLFPVNYVKM
jgi:hypothetical protein